MRHKLCSLFLFWHKSGARATRPPGSYLHLADTGRSPGAQLRAGQWGARGPLRQRPGRAQLGRAGGSGRPQVHIIATRSANMCLAITP